MKKYKENLKILEEGYVYSKEQKVESNAKIVKKGYKTTHEITFPAPDTNPHGEYTD